MGFKKIRGLNIPYNRQGLIYFTLRNYRQLDWHVRRHIDALIAEAARGEATRAEALRRWLIIGEIDAHGAALAAYTAEATMYRARKWIYEHY